MKVLIAPLNWGLGHATRCIPLVHRYIQDGAEVWLGGTGESLQLLKSCFPNLTSIELAPLDIRYNAGKSQVTAMLRAIPQIIRFARKNRRKIKQLLESTHFDLIVSDNCFGVWSDRCDCVYMTHQLHICLPKKWSWLESAASKCHAHLYKKYKEIWVPDYADEPNLSGIQGHPAHLDNRVKYIGPLSRFEAEAKDFRSDENSNSQLSTDTYDVVAVLSGPEPQRTIFEQEIIARYIGKKDRVLIVRGKIGEPKTCITRRNISLISHVNTHTMTNLLRNSKRIIARSGYSTVMDLHVLGLLDKAELYPTPGQPEQEYLALRINSVAHQQVCCSREHQD